MPQKPSFGRRAERRVNAVVTSLRSSRLFGRAMQRRLTVITYVGRRSGRTISTPVSFSRAGDVVTIGVMAPDAKTWWRNFLGDGGPITIELDGAERTGHAHSQRDAKGRVSVTVTVGANF